MKIGFLGDIHGDFSVARKMAFRANRKGCEALIQVGDFGLFREEEIGIINKIKAEYPVLHWIRGNHDYPQLCQKTNGYLGDFGYNEEFGIFYIGGAWSIDQWHRTEGVNWWRDEELSWSQWNQCLELYEKIQPKIVVSHDAPMSIMQLLCSHHSGDHSMTQKGLEMVYNLHHPKIWIHGHHHKSKINKTEDTNFICLGINEFKLVETNDL